MRILSIPTRFLSMTSPKLRVEPKLGDRQKLGDPLPGTTTTVTSGADQKLDGKNPIAPSLGVKKLVGSSL
jgi:hypothetical protein